MTLSITPEILLAPNILGFYVAFSPMIYLFIELIRNVPRFRIIPPLIPSWLVVSTFMITVIGTGGLYHSDGANPGDYVLLFTLVILIFYTYYTYSLAVISAKGPALLEVQKFHTNDLREFLSSWLNALEYRRNFNVDFSNDPKKYVSTNERLESNLMYKDFLNHHIPTKYGVEVDLRSCWENYKIDRNLLESKSYKLYMELHSELESALGIDDSTSIDIIVKDIYKLCFDTNRDETYRKPKVEISQGQMDISYYSISREQSNSYGFKTTYKLPEQAKSDFDNVIAESNIKKYKKYTDEMKTISSNLGLTQLA